MISIIVYGRNDGYGYNLHKRCAISINCMAEVFDHPEDELIFVDYNSPALYPTFPEAIADTLTAKAKKLLRIIRVPPSIHQEYFARKTHLHVLEPISRNIALRRINPKNPWVLSTNLDMVFVPQKGKSISQMMETLEDGFYGMPRYEMPERLWESVDRKKPKEIISQFDAWAERLCLMEVVTVADDVGFDAPGDFQLCRREDLETIHGFHEDMLRGWHVDSNLFKRLGLYHGRNPSKALLHRFDPYHCSHTFSTGTMHRARRKENSLVYFYEGVTQPFIPAQAEHWGMPDQVFEEVRLTGNVGVNLLAEVANQSPARRQEKPNVFCISDLNYARGVAVWEKICFTYDTEHVFPYVLNALAQADIGRDFIYLGENEVMRSKLRYFKERYGGKFYAFGLKSIILERCKGIMQTMQKCTSVVLFLDCGLDTSQAHLHLGDAFRTKKHLRGTAWFMAFRKFILNNHHIFRGMLLAVGLYFRFHETFPVVLINTQRDHLLSLISKKMIAQTQTPHTTRVRFGLLGGQNKSSLTRLERTKFKLAILVSTVFMRHPSLFHTYRKFPLYLRIWLRWWIIGG